MGIHVDIIIHWSSKCCQSNCECEVVGKLEHDIFKLMNTDFEAICFNRITYAYGIKMSCFLPLMKLFFSYFFLSYRQSQI